MRFFVIQNRIDRYDPVRINRVVAVMVVSHDVRHVDRPGDTGPLIKLAQVGPHVGVVDDAFAVAFEMQVINRVEPYQCRE